MTSLPLRSDRTADDAAVRSVLDALAALADTWAAGDGTGYGNLFTDDASYTTYVDTTYRGAAEIGRAHQALFAKVLGGTRLACQVEELRFVGDDVAVLTSRGGVHKPGRTAELDKVQTLTLVRVGPTWRVTAFHNTARRRWVEWLSFRFVPGSRPVG